MGRASVQCFAVCSYTSIWVSPNLGTDMGLSNPKKISTTHKEESWALLELGA
ncbi:unnamed protein product [Ilex paraguariensis]|uniref:Uncharacterized protein n=1 Tax=Ilex paraguariensis TaxID=185542 RepID=A0ABC8T1J3_9AQUA